MGIYETIIGRRTIRKFKQDKIDIGILERLINAGRLAPSAANLQPVRYKIVNDLNVVAKVNNCVKWAAYINPEGNPKEHECPTAYIVVLVDSTIANKWADLDVGAAVQNIMLAAWEDGIGTCWMASIDRDNLREELKIPEVYMINTVIALGYAGESPVIQDEAESIKYFKDENGVLHVPKRKIEDIII